MEPLLLPARTVDVEDREENKKKTRRNSIIMTFLCIVTFVALLIYCLWFSGQRSHQQQVKSNTYYQRRLH